MIAYVVQYLKHGDSALAFNTPTGTCSTTAASASQSRRNVYFHHCKDDGTTNKATNVFCSLVAQLLKDHQDLCSHFDSQVQKLKKDGHPRPLSDPNCMKDLLIDLVTMLPPPTFLIIDGLDECLPIGRKFLFDFMEQVCDRTTSIRVLTSARASHLGGGEKLFPKTAVPICSWNLTTDHSAAKRSLHCRVPCGTSHAPRIRR